MAAAAASTGTAAEALLDDVLVSLHAGDHGTAGYKCLRAVMALPVGHEERWTLFRQATDSILAAAYGHQSSSSTRNNLIQEVKYMLEKRFVESREEPLLFRAQAAYTLASLFCKPDLLQLCLEFCSEVTQSDRRRTVLVVELDHKEDPVHVPKCVGDELDRLTELARNLQVGVAAYLSENAKELLVQLLLLVDKNIDEKNDRPFVEEMAEMIISRKEELCLNCLLTVTPAISSGLIEQVRALPQKATALLIERSSYFDTRSDIVDGPVYGVFTVDLDRYREGKTRRVFKKRMPVECKPNDSEAKHLIGTFAAFCLRPNDFFSNEPYRERPFRPQTVLFWRPEQANHAQVRAFLNMMGCRDIQVAEPALMSLFHATLDKQSRENTRRSIDKEKSPHLYERFIGRHCANCGKTDPDAIRQCVCHAAWYCSKSCQTEHWKDHKAEHRKVAEKEGEKQPGV